MLSERRETIILGCAMLGGLLVLLGACVVLVVGLGFLPV
jgi:hypothetical protein